MARPRREACRTPGPGVRVAVEPTRHAGPVEAPPGRQGFANSFDNGEVGVAAPDVTGAGAQVNELGGVPDDQAVAVGGARPRWTARPPAQPRASAPRADTQLIHCSKVAMMGRTRSAPGPVTTAAASLSTLNKAFGRRFEIVTFRWLSQYEI